MAHPDITIAGQTYPLGHLNPFTITVEPKPDSGYRACKILVTFSCHVYSLDWDAAHHPASHLVEHEGERRCFCPSRYGWSLDLPDLVRYHARGKSYISRDGNGFWNHLFYEPLDVTKRAVPYPIYIRLNRVRDMGNVDGVCHVISAYENPKISARNQLQSTRFAKLVSDKIGFEKE
jgi:hypothetical protein